MSHSPDDLIQVHNYLKSKTGLPDVELGVVGDDSHDSTGGYHVGNDALSIIGRLISDYSKRESSRDRPGSNAASAIDIGNFKDRVSLTSFILQRLRSGDPRLRDVREMIYSLDGRTVQRWDRLGVRSSGDSSHFTHTHISFFRDSEGRRHLRDNFMGVLIEYFDGSEMLTDAEVKRIVQDVTNAILRGTWEAGYIENTFDKPYRSSATDPLVTVAAVFGAVNQVKSEVAAVRAKLDSLAVGSGLSDSDRQLLENVRAAIAGLAPGV